MLPITSTPDVLLNGLSRLATQQTASGDAVNQMPRYLLLRTSSAGEKNPRVNEPPAETSVSQGERFTNPTFSRIQKV